jgi:hypothetical protein
VLTQLPLQQIDRFIQRRCTFSDCGENERLVILDYAQDIPLLDQAVISSIDFLVQFLRRNRYYLLEFIHDVELHISAQADMAYAQYHNLASACASYAQRLKIANESIEASDYLIKADNFYRQSLLLKQSNACKVELALFLMTQSQDSQQAESYLAGVIGQGHDQSSLHFSLLFDSPLPEIQCWLALVNQVSVIPFVLARYLWFKLNPNTESLEALRELVSHSPTKDSFSKFLLSCAENAEKMPLSLPKLAQEVYSALSLPSFEPALKNSEILPMIANKGSIKRSCQALLDEDNNKQYYPDIFNTVLPWLLLTLPPSVLRQINHASEFQVLINKCEQLYHLFNDVELHKIPNYLLMYFMMNNTSSLLSAYDLRMDQIKALELLQENVTESAHGYRVSLQLCDTEVSVILSLYVSITLLQHCLQKNLLMEIEDKSSKTSMIEDSLQYTFFSPLPENEQEESPRDSPTLDNDGFREENRNGKK